MRTLFVVGTQFSVDIMDKARENDCKHIYLGANQSFNPNNDDQKEDWDDMIMPLLEEGWLVTLDYDVKYHQHVVDFDYNRFENFISQISVKMPKIENLNENAYNKLIKANTSIYEAPFYIDETPAISIAQIASRSRRLKRQLNGNLGLIVIDYIQLIMGLNKNNENRVQELSTITRGLKAIAKELNIPVVALSQLSRAVEQREDKRPNLADLRESGSIEQDADVVMFVFREDYYHEKMEPIRKGGETEEQLNERYENWKSYYEKIKGQAQIIIAKQRHGPIGTINLSFNDRFTKFGNFIRNDNIPEGF